MLPKSQKLYLRVAFAIGIVALLSSLVTAGVTYFYNLSQQTQLNTELVNQLANSATKTSAIAAYLEDDDLALEIVNGLVSNNIISAASIVNFEAMAIQAGDLTQASQRISIPLVHPFAGDEVVGELTVFPNRSYIEEQAQAFSLQNASTLIFLSFLIAIFVSLLVHRRLTRPIKNLTLGFTKVDPNVPETMQTIDIGYRRRDEIGVLVSGINALMIALKQNLQTERILRERTQTLEQRFRLIFEQASAGIGLIDHNNQFFTLNPAMQNLFNQSCDGVDVTTLFSDSPHVATTLEQMRSREPFSQVSMDLEYESEGQRRWLHCLFAKLSEQRAKRRLGNDILIEMIAYDVTDRIQREQETRFEADHDSLTQLQNRRSGEAALEGLLDSALDHDATFVLMMIDLDRFKPINDTYGHDVGDEVLVLVARRLRRHFNMNMDVCVRWGGDEFVIGFKHSRYNEAEIKSLAHLLLQDISSPMSISETITCEVGASIGIVCAPQHGTTLDSLLQQADSTMYKVKQRGRNNYLIAETE
ncbi:sensor domain-containing diguanylate cyclase [Alteromonas flava]|uniref:sensor domain-containing diguanylate cyclase n=1 Tax=Alteromonas flava TaxID=2048003 RepID=UPI000C2917E8|nr:sensor domain-containing diguanylate cyclase [Alteromonas flava]